MAGRADSRGAVCRRRRADCASHDHSRHRQQELPREQVESRRDSIRAAFKLSSPSSRSEKQEKTYCKNGFLGALPKEIITSPGPTPNVPVPVALKRYRYRKFISTLWQRFWLQQRHARVRAVLHRPLRRGFGHAPWQGHAQDRVARRGTQSYPWYQTAVCTAPVSQLCSCVYRITVVPVVWLP